MVKKLQMTGFARFLLIMVIATPLAFLGASYYNGQDGIKNLKELLGIGRASDRTEAPAKTGTDSLPEKQEQAEEAKKEDPLQVNSQIQKLTDELEIKNRQIDTLYLTTERLKLQLAEKEKELVEVKMQLDKIKRALK